MGFGDGSGGEGRGGEGRAGEGEEETKGRRRGRGRSLFHPEVQAKKKKCQQKTHVP
jgi:hypothetical protein